MGRLAPNNAPTLARLAKQLVREKSRRNSDYLEEADFLIKRAFALAVAGHNFLSVQFMKTNLNLLQMCIYSAVALGMGSFPTLAAATEGSADTAPAI